MAEAKTTAPKKAARKATENIEEVKVIAAIGYLGLLFLVPLLARPKSKYAIFHANQGLLLLITAVAGNFVLGAIPVLGWMLMPLWGLAILAMVIYGAVNALNGKTKELPVIGGFEILKPQK